MIGVMPLSQTAKVVAMASGSALELLHGHALRTGKNASTIRMDAAAAVAKVISGTCNANLRNVQ